MENVIGLLITWAIITVAILIVGAVVPGAEVKGVKGAIIVALIFAIINWLIGRFLWSQPAIAGASMGMLWQLVGYWVTNIILLKITDMVSKNLSIKGFMAAIWSGLVMAVLLVGVSFLRSKVGV